MAGYDIGDALRRIELLLLQSMRRNLHRHLTDERDEGIRWSMWQAEQLTTLGNWTRRNYRQYAPEFSRINGAAISLLQSSAARAQLVEEDLLLRTGIQRAGGFFVAPEEKLQSLLNAVRHDLSQAEHSILRQADDVYRRTLFDAQMYLQTGSGTLDNAIDMAVQDFMQRGIRSVVYRNGHRVEASTYARMALRTANVRAVMTGEGAARDRFGVHTVIVSPSGIACEKCAPWMGQILVDDVYCSGSREEAAELGVPLLSEAVSSGLLHPQCNCAVHTFQPGISKLPEVTDADREQAVNRYKLTQQQRYNERQIRKWKYAEDAAPDPAAQQAAHAKVRAWQQTNKALCDAHPAELRRDYQREKIWDAPRNPVVPGVIEKTPDRPTTALKTPNDLESDKVGFLQGIFSGESTKSYQKVVEQFDDLLPKMENKTVSGILKRVKERTVFMESDRKNSYFQVKDKSTGAIVLRVRLAKSATPSTIAHELFHKVDYENHITADGMLDACLSADYERLKKLAKTSGQTLGDMLYLNYPEAFARKGKMKEAYRGVSDLIDGMTKGSVWLGYGHSHSERKYWDKPLALQKETFAQYGRFWFDNTPEIIQLLEILFPATTKQMNAIILAIAQIGR